MDQVRELSENGNFQPSWEQGLGWDQREDRHPVYLLVLYLMVYAEQK